MKDLTQEIFEGQPDSVNWAGVDYDGLLSFGTAVNPRYTHSSERWRGFYLSSTIENTDFKRLTSITKEGKEDADLINGIAIKLFLLAKNESLLTFKNFVKENYDIKIK